MIGIPSTNFGVGLDQFALPFDEGVNRLIDTAGIAEVTNVVDGMLFHNGSVMLTACETEKQMLICKVRADILREIKGHIIQRMTPDEKEINNAHLR